MPEEDPNSALFRIEVIQVPLANPENAAIVSSPRIFDDLVAPESHGLAPDDLKAIEDARAAGKFIAQIGSQSIVLPDGFANMQIDSIMRARGGTTPNAADSVSFREYLPRMFEAMTGGSELAERGPTQCHDITVFPAIGMAGGACEGYGLLLDISDPTNPTRLAAVADSNFSYWHSATFNNDGTQVVFTDEWGGGGGPKCRATDPKEWGANAIFTIDGSDLNFTSYYKMPAPQTSFENCVAHNGSLIPIPGRDIMVQSWYQGGISIFDWTDPSNPVEIAFHDRGPSDANTMGAGGSWSIYWYNGLLVSSEIARGLDIFELVASEAISQNEIDAANSVVLDELNSQGQPILEWPFTFALARAYVDQLERSRAVSQGWVTDVRNALSGAEGASDSVQADALRGLASQIEDAAGQSRDADKMRMLADAVRGLAGA